MTGCPESGITGERTVALVLFLTEKEENHVTGSIGNGGNQRTDRSH